jgi:hypothetical protein
MTIIPMTMERFNYTLINSTETNEKFDKHASKFCYYCGETDISKFKGVPHLTPELLTRNDNTYNYECDTCNQFFSTEYENHLTEFTRPFVVLYQCKTKKGYPKIKMPNGDSIQFKDGQLEINNLHNSFKIVRDKKKNTATIEVPRKKFIPYKVYKSLVKIGISLLPPDKIENYRDTIQWLKNPQLDSLFNLSDLAKGYTFKLNSQKYNEPFAELYEAKQLLIGNTEYIQHILIVGFANFAIQIFLPLSKEHAAIYDPTHGLALDVSPIVIAGYKSSISNTPLKAYDLAHNAEVIHPEIFTIFHAKPKLRFLILSYFKRIWTYLASNQYLQGVFKSRATSFAKNKFPGAEDSKSAQSLPQPKA